MQKGIKKLVGGGVFFALLLFGGFVLSQNTSITIKQLDVGLIYTSGCTIGNIKREDPSSFDTLQKQIDYCNTIGENMAGIFLYDFAQKRNFEIDEEKRAKLQNNLNLMTFPENILGEANTLSPQSPPYDKGQIVQYDNAKIECAIENNTELRVQTMRCTKQSKWGKEKIYTFAESEIIKPHFYLIGDRHKRIKQELIK